MLEKVLTERVDLLVARGTVVSSRGRTEADVAVRDGRIVAVGSDIDVAPERVIDVLGRLVLPGIIDAHTHPVYADDLGRTGLAGVSAGVTSVIAFVAAFPSWGFPKTTPDEVVADYLSRWDGHPPCDFALHVAFDAVDDVADQVPRLVARGVSSFKFFLAYRKRGMMVDDRALIAGLETVGKAGGIAAVHAENGDGIDHLESSLWEEPGLPNGAFLACHTHLFEAEAVLRVVALAEAVKCPVYIPHLAAGDGLDVIALARRTSRVPIWVETCPHYLSLTNQDVLDRGALSKIAPPLRHAEDNERLWRGLAAQTVQFIATDHAGRTLKMKAQGANILQAPYGAEGIEHLLPLVYGDGVRGGRITLERMVTLLCENPADLFGLSPRKGRITVGADADLAILDPNGTTECTVGRHVGASDYCLYEGRTLPGAVTHTIRRGQILLDDGELSRSATGGIFLPREPLSIRGTPMIDGIAAAS